MAATIDTAAGEVIETVALACKAGSADKVYNLSLVQTSPNGWTVKAMYGRRNGTLQPTTVCFGKSEEYARKKFEDTVRTKLRSSPPYQVVAGADVSQFVQTEVTERDRDSAKLPVQLLTEITDVELAQMIAGKRGRVGFLEKIDGHRRMLVIGADGRVISVNKLGLYRGMPTEIAKFAKQTLPRDSVVDGELVGDTFFAFDVQKWDGVDMTGDPFESRHAWLDTELTSTDGLIRVVPWVGAEVAAQYIACLKQNRKEGIVVRGLDDDYRNGRTGKSWKYKFLKTCTVVVMGENETAKGKASFEVGVYRDGKLTGIGTAYPTKGQPVQIGDCVEMRYRKCAFDGRLMETFFLGVRDDVLPDECQHSKIIFYDRKA